MSRKIRITLTDEQAAKLDAHVARTGRTEADVIVAGYMEYEAACSRIAGWSQMDQQVVPNGPVSWSQTDRCAQPVASVAVTPVRSPHAGVRPGDSDATIALIETLNGLPNSTDASDDDLALVYASRRVDLQRQIARNREADRKTEAAEGVTAVFLTI